MMKLASFDIFDTVLIRTCGRPDNVFWLLAQKLFPDDMDKQVEFAKWRIDRNAGAINNPNYNLQDVYADQEVKAFKGSGSSQFVKSEEKLESDVLRRNEMVIPLLAEYRKKGYHIAFISDMYLPESLIKSVLVREQIMEQGDSLYVSNEVKHRKDDGSLYDYVRNELKPTEWIHIGDNEFSDYKIPKDMGIKSRHVVTPFTDIENDIRKLSNAFCPPYELAVLTGLQRYARTAGNNDAKANLAVDYVAPAYIPYVMHVLSGARRRGIRRLYFLSRDSYILQKIAEQLPHENIEFKYFFVSRASLLLPYLYKADRETFNLIFTNDLIHVDKLLDRIGLSMDYLKSKDIAFGFEKAETEEERKEVLDIVFRPDIYAHWQKLAADKFNICVKYLKQEGLLDDTPFALVDVGWLGTTRLMINSLRHRLRPGLKPCLSYYWSTMSGMLSSQYGPFDIFMRNFPIDPNFCWYVEDYFSLCPYSTTIGYRESESGEVRPELKDVDTSSLASILDENLKVILPLTKAIFLYGFSDEVLYAWSVLSMEALKNSKYEIDYSPMVGVCSDDDAMIRKITIREYLNLAWHGTSYAKNDYASVLYSFGNKTGRRLWSLAGRVMDKKVEFYSFIKKFI